MNNRTRFRRSFGEARPLVSVIMPVYNAGGFVVEAIGSILAQTVADFELLIIDDRSTDGSWKKIRSYAKKDKRIRIFRNKVRKGLVKSLNFLIPLTRGKYIARVDADDISLPHRFRKQIALLESNEKLVACGGQEYIIDGTGKIIARKSFPVDSRECYDKLMNYMVIQPPVLMARGEIFRRYRYDNHIFKNDDITMHFKLLREGDFSNVDNFIFQYRKLETSLTHRDAKKVYFLALKARINALLNEDFHPALANILLAVAETLLVAFLPSKAIIFLFELMRQKNGGKLFFPNAEIFLSLRKAAKALNLL